jgi:hypothetical protein
MNVMDRLTTRRSRNALKSLAAGATLLTLGVGGVAAQPDQAVAAVDLLGPAVENAEAGLVHPGGSGEFGDALPDGEIADNVSSTVENTTGAVRNIVEIVETIWG